MCPLLPTANQVFRMACRCSRHRPFASHYPPMQGCCRRSQAGNTHRKEGGLKKSEGQQKGNEEKGTGKHHEEKKGYDGKWDGKQGAPKH